MNATRKAGAGQQAENHSGMNTDCAECAKLAEKLEKCKGSAENNGEASGKSPKARKEECKHLRMRIRKSS